MTSNRNSRFLQVSLAVLICMIIAAAIVFAKVGQQRQVVYYDTSPKYDQKIVQLGLQASKFGGLALHLDSPNVLLNKSERLELTDAQREQLQAIIDRARREAVALLTPIQLEKISPIAAEPVVFAKLDRTYASCDSCTLPGACTEGCTLDHAHQDLAPGEHAEGHGRDPDEGHDHSH